MIPRCKLWLLLQGLAQLSHSPALQTPPSLGHKSRSQDLESQGLLNTDSLLGSLTSALPIDDHGLMVSRLSQIGSTQVSADSDSGSEQRSVNAANISVTQAGAFLVRQGSSTASRPGLTSGHLTVERLPVSPRLLSRRSVSLTKQTSKKALQDSTAAVAALQLTGAPLQSLGSRRTARLSRELASNSSSNAESSISAERNSRSRSSQVIELQPGSSDAADFVAVGDNHNAEGLLHCLKVKGASDGSRLVSGRESWFETYQLQVHLVMQKLFPGQ